MICYLYNAVAYFLQNWYFVLSCIGIIWVTSMWVWIFSSLDGIIKELKSNFEMPESEFEKIAQKLKTSVASDKIAFLVSLPGFVFVAYNVKLTLDGVAVVFVKIPASINGNLMFIAYLIILSSFCIYLVLATAHMFLSALRYLKLLTNSTVKLKILQKKRKVDLSKTINAILKTTFSWFVGVSLIMVLLLTFSNITIIASLLFVIAIGMAFFFIPQILFHKSICRSKEKLLERIESDFASKTNLPISSDCDSQNSLLLCMLYEQVEKISEWPLNTGLILQLFVSAIIPVITTVTGIIIK